jgi:DHA1 family bicyclomycin/chloramphenicol resistance-like MFS transporter
MTHTDSPTSNRLLVALMVLLVLFSPMAIDIYLPALSHMAGDFNVSPTLAQDTVTWFMFSLGLGQLFAGPLADRFGRKPVAVIGILLYGLSSLMAWLATSMDMMLVARLLQGFGACATSVCAFAAVRDRFGAERSGHMISYLNGAICFVPALAPLLGSWLTQVFDWRANFTFMLGYAVLGLVLVIVFLPETRPSHTDTSGRLFSLRRYWQVLRVPTFTYHITLCMLAMAVILAYVTSAPVLLMDRYGISMNSFTFWFGANAALNIAAAMLGPRYMQKFGSRRALNIGLMMLVGSGGLMLALSHIAAPWAFMLPIFTSSFGFAWVLGASAGAALAPFSDRAGTAAALLGLFQMSGAGLLVSLTQRLGLSASDLMTVHMWLLVPGLIILWSPKGKQWHAKVVKS